MYVVITDDPIVKLARWWWTDLQTTTIADENLSDMAKAQMLTAEDFFFSLIHITFSLFR